MVYEFAEHLTPAERYDRCKAVCKSLALIASQVPMVKYLDRFATLQQVCDAWMDDKDVRVVVLELHKDPSPDSNSHFDVASPNVKKDQDETYESWNRLQINLAGRLFQFG